MGHPDWDLVLSAIAEQHAPEIVDVFFCGPVGRGQKLRKVCTRRDLKPPVFEGTGKECVDCHRKDCNESPYPRHEGFPVT